MNKDMVQTRRASRKRRLDQLMELEEGEIKETFVDVVNDNDVDEESKCDENNSHFENNDEDMMNNDNETRSSISHSASSTSHTLHSPHVRPRLGDEAMISSREISSPATGRGGEDDGADLSLRVQHSPSSPESERGINRNRNPARNSSDATSSSPPLWFQADVCVRVLSKTSNRPTFVDPENNLAKIVKVCGGNYAIIKTIAGDEAKYINFEQCTLMDLTENDIVRIWDRVNDHMGREGILLSLCTETNKDDAYVKDCHSEEVHVVKLRHLAKVMITEEAEYAMRGRVNTISLSRYHVSSSSTPLPLAEQLQKGAGIEWREFSKRIGQHPKEVIPRILIDALLIPSPPVPSDIIRQLLYAKDRSDLSFGSRNNFLRTTDRYLGLIRLETIKIMSICPWISTSMVHNILETDAILMEQQSERAERRRRHDRRIEEFVAHRSTSLESDIQQAFASLKSPLDSTPPRLAITDVILEYYPEVLKRQDSIDNTIMHYACSSEMNYEYVLQLARHGAEADIALDEEGWDNSEFTYASMLTRNNWGMNPLRMIAVKWSDDKATKVFKEISRILNFHPEDIVYQEFLHEAIRMGKWKLCQCILEKFPQTTICNAREYYTTVLKQFSDTELEEDSLWLFKTLIKTSLDMVNTISCYEVDEGENDDKDERYKIIGSLSNVDRNSHVDTTGGLTKHHYSGHPLLVIFKKSPRVFAYVCDSIFDYILTVIETPRNGLLCTLPTEKNLECVRRTTRMLIVTLIDEIAKIGAFDTLTKIITSHPEFLKLKEKQGLIPLHCICRSNAPIELIQLTIELGVQQQVGGKTGRGGLAICDNKGIAPIQLLASRKHGHNLRLFRTLMEPKRAGASKKYDKGKVKNKITSLGKMIKNRDVKNLQLVHSVAKGGNASVVRQILKICPEGIGLVDENGRIPLHIACMDGSIKPQMLRILLKEGVKRTDDLSGVESKAGLLLLDDDRKTPLDYLMMNLSISERRWGHLRVLFEGIVSGVPLIQAAIDNVINSQRLSQLIEKFPSACCNADLDGRYPLHIAYESNNTWPHQREMIRDHNPDAVGIIDDITNLYPFMTAASRPNIPLGEIYHLLRQDPSMIASTR